MTPPKPSPKTRSTAGSRKPSAGRPDRESPASASSPGDRAKPIDRERSAEERKLISALTDTYQMLGTIVVGASARFQDPGLMLSGLRMANTAEETADAWIDLSRRNPAVKNALLKFTEISAGGVVVGMHIAMFAPLAASRGIVPAGLAGITPEESEEMTAFMMAAAAPQNGPGGSN